MRKLIMLIMTLLFCVSVAAQDGSDMQYKIAFVVFREHKFFLQLFLINLDGTNRVPLTDIQAGEEAKPNWTQDGSGIVFTSTRSAHPENTGYDAENILAGEQIYTVQLGSYLPQRLTNTLRSSGIDSAASHPVLSPDGQYIAFRHQNGTFVMHVDGSQPTQLLERAYGAVWSPDSCCVALNLIQQIGNTFERHIIIVDIATRKVVQITDRHGFDHVLDWSSATRQLLFMSDRSGGLDLYRMNADGTGIFQLTHSSRGDGIEAAWSPDGKWIAYYEIGDNDLVIITPDGRLLTRLPRALIPNPNLQWLPDNTGLLFYGAGYDETRQWSYKWIKQLNTACLEVRVIQCSEADISTIPGTKSPPTSDFAVSPIKLPAQD